MLELQVLQVREDIGIDDIRAREIPQESEKIGNVPCGVVEPWSNVVEKNAKPAFHKGAEMAPWTITPLEWLSESGSNYYRSVKTATVDILG